MPNQSPHPDPEDSSADAQPPSPESSQVHKPTDADHGQSSRSPEHLTVTRDWITLPLSEDHEEEVRKGETLSVSI